MTRFAPLPAVRHRNIQQMRLFQRGQHNRIADQFTTREAAEAANGQQEDEGLWQAHGFFSG